MRLAKFVGQCVLFLASMALLTGVSLFIVGGYLATWPILRQSPRSARMQALVGLGTAIFALVQAYGLREHTEPESAYADRNA